MKWSLNELRQTVDEQLTFSETLDLKDELMARNSDIIEVWEELWNGWKTAKNSREQKKIEFRS